jgi:adenylate kinase
MKAIAIFLGPPGAGKGSLARICADRLGWVKLSTGDLCRKHIADQTPLGRQITEIIEAGGLISDDMVVTMVKDWFTQHADVVSAVILDGFPRTLQQAQAFDNFLKNTLISCKLTIVKLFLPDNSIINRLSNRLVCSNRECQTVYSAVPEAHLLPEKYGQCDRCGSPLSRRRDDIAETIRERLQIYHTHEREIVDYYQDEGNKIIEINAEQPLEEVFKQFSSLIGQ